jgi:hypothetical protein
MIHLKLNPAKYINKGTAQNTAFNMLKSSRDKISAKELDLSDLCEALILKHIPQKEIELIDQLSEGWVEKSTYFSFTNPYGKNYEHFSTTHSLPKKQFNSTINLSGKDFELIQSLKAEIIAMKDKEKQISEQIVATLLKLRTAERIKKEFPDAYKNLPKDSMDESTVLALPINKILESIEKFPS